MFADPHWAAHSFGAYFYDDNSSSFQQTAQRENVKLNAFSSVFKTKLIIVMGTWNAVFIQILLER